MVDSAQGDITRILKRWERGDPGAVEELAPLFYGQLHAIAESYLRNERPDHSLQPTVVVNEVFIGLLRVRRLALKDRSHSFAFLVCSTVQRLRIASAHFGRRPRFRA